MSASASTLSKRRRRLLMDAAGVEALLNASPDQDVIFIEVIFHGEVAHGEQSELSPRSRRCIPGAVQVHPSYFEAELDESKYYPLYNCPADGNLLADELLHAAIARLGITEDSTVVVYGKGVVSAMSACRALWALMYAGVKDARVLDGGFAAWESYGGKMAEAPVPPVPVANFSTCAEEEGICRQDFLATSDEVGAVSRGESPGIIVDVRKLGEYEGWLKDNYGFFDIAGHIPTAFYQGDWDELVYVETGKLRSLEDVEARWRSLGINIAPPDGNEPQPPLIFYCGTGWRSSVAFVLAYMMGLNAKNYDDGWYGWSVGLAASDVRTCRPGCGCNIEKDRAGLTVKAMEDQLLEAVIRSSNSNSTGHLAPISGSGQPN